MISRKNLSRASAGLCLLGGLLSYNAAAQQYFDVNGTTTGSGVTASGAYSWESAVWSTSSTGVATPVTWVDGTFARFAAGTDAGTKAYTVTANADHIFAGMFLTANGGSTLTINGTGILSLASGTQGVLVNSSSQNLRILSIIGGTGQLENELSGSLYLYGNNTYTGGTLLGTVAGVNFNNSSSFGTGAITWGVAQQVMADPEATGPITLANNMTTRAASTLIFVTPTVAPVTISGTTTLIAGNSTFTMNTAATKLTLGGNISGAGGNIVKNGAGTMVISGTNNTYSGTTTISAGRLTLGIANAIGSSSRVILSGGILDAGGFNQAMGATTLSMTASSSIDFGAGAVEMDLANSSALTWTGILNLVNWDFLSDKIRFGTDGTGLTGAQVADIEFNGTGLGTAFIDSQGFIVVPEPSAVCLGVLGGLGMILTIKRRKG